MRLMVRSKTGRGTAASSRSPRLTMGRWPLGMAVAVGGRGRHGGSVALVAYSTPKPAYAALIKAFNATRPARG